MSTSSGQNREPIGTPVGGQFAITARAEADVALAGPTGREDVPEITAAREAFADALGVPVDEVTLEVDESHSCWNPPGTVHVRLSTSLPDDPLHQEVSIGFDRHPTGRTIDLGCSVGWDREPLGDDDPYRRDATTTPLSPAYPANPAGIATVVAHTLRQAKIQRALNAKVNDPQSLATAANGRKRWLDILLVDAQVTSEGTRLSVEDRRTRDGRSRIWLDVDDTGRVLAGAIDTSYGRMDLAGENLDRACVSLERELSWVTGERDAVEPTRDRLQARLAAVLAAAA